MEWIGFSWLAAGGRHQSHLDGEGNPYVFLTRVVREVEVESGDEGEDGAGEGKVLGGGEVDGGGEENAAMEMKKKKDLPIVLWADNDLNISEVQGVKMWDKEIWAGRL